jgi:hypothetical protein
LPLVGDKKSDDLAMWPANFLAAGAQVAHRWL